MQNLTYVKEVKTNLDSPSFQAITYPNLNVFIVSETLNLE